MDTAIRILPIHILMPAVHHYTSATHVKSVQLEVPRGSYPQPIQLSSAIDWLSS